MITKYYYFKDIKSMSIVKTNYCFINMLSVSIAISSIYSNKIQDTFLNANKNIEHVFMKFYYGKKFTRCKTFLLVRIARITNPPESTHFISKNTFE